MVALLMAAIYPERVRAVVADSFAERLDPNRLRAEVAERRKREPGAVAFWRHAQGDDWEQVVEADSELLLRLANRGGDWLRGRLPQVRCPVLFTASLRDQLVPNAAADCARMAARLPGSEVFLVNAGWHPLMWSQPTAFRRVVDGFLPA
jgi:pimeloyl-ACP methyl ester carboxylesterase